MDEIKIIVFDEDEFSKTLIESYLKDVTFKYSLEKFNKFDSSNIEKSENKKIIITCVNKLSTEALAEIAISAADKKNNYIILSNDKSTDLNVMALRAGAKEFLVKPLGKSDFLNAVQKIYTKNIVQPKTAGGSAVYAAASFKSGEGKSIFLINLAKEVADVSKEKVLLVDFNNSLNDLSSLLDVNFLYNVNYFVNNLDEANYKKLLSNLPLYKNSTLSVMGNGYYKAINEKMTADDISKAFKLLRKYYKYIFVDRCIENYDLDNTVLKNVDSIFYLIPAKTDNPDSIGHDFALHYKNRNVLLVCNKYETKYEQNLDEIKSEVGREVYALLPQNHIAAGSAVRNRKTFKEISPELDIVKAYSELAMKIVDGN